jgi:ABC-2 type transport system permease protein
MIGALRAEWLKLRSVRSNVLLMVAIVVVGVGLGTLLSAVVPATDGRRGDPSPLRDPFDRLGIALVGLNLCLLLFGVLGVQIIGQEYRFSTIRATFAATPRRLRVVVAKLVVLMATTGVVAAVTLALALGINGAILSGRGFGLDLSTDGAGRYVLGTFLLAFGYALVGFAVGMILRQPIGGIILVLAWPIVVENLIVGFLRTSAGSWMPYSAGSQLLARTPDADLLGPWAGFGYFIAFGAVLALIGAALVNRRDA